MKKLVKKSMVLAFCIAMVWLPSIGLAQDITRQNITAEWWKTAKLSGTYTVLPAHPTWLLKSVEIPFTCHEHVTELSTSSPNRYGAIGDSILVLQFGEKISSLSLKGQAFNEYDHWRVIDKLSVCDCEQSGGRVDSLLIIIRDLRKQIKEDNNDDHNSEDDCPNCNYETEFECKDGRLVVNSNVEYSFSELAELAKAMGCNCHCNDGGDVVSDVPNREVEEQQQNRPTVYDNEDDNVDDRILSSSFSINLLPGNQSIFGVAGVDLKLGNRFSVNTGFAAGWKRFDQTHVVTPTGVDVTSSTSTYWGLNLGGNYKISNRFAAGSSLTAWGLDKDDFFVSIYGTYRVKRNVNLGLSLNLGKEIKGIGVIANF